jgi:hypothetical protein
MKTITEVRTAFWDENSKYAPEFKARKRQNEYSCDIRCAFVEYVDYLRKDGRISESLAFRVTL